MNFESAKNHSKFERCRIQMQTLSHPQLFQNQGVDEFVLTVQLVDLCSRSRNRTA